MQVNHEEVDTVLGGRQKRIEDNIKHMQRGFEAQSEGWSEVRLRSIVSNLDMVSRGVCLKKHRSVCWPGVVRETGQRPDHRSRYAMICSTSAFPSPSYASAMPSPYVRSRNELARGCLRCLSDLGRTDPPGCQRWRGEVAPSRAKENPRHPGSYGRANSRAQGRAG